ncbi:glycerol-3-phosphate dehydrogenase/oxidase [Hydrogenophaga sp. OTU3427]|uniref:glycerol-3-phosphate dehydrogenase/oxidase n=1 Tax=Hydrogenophaga sp. OTU3427 TaxID=3043856 RepID=UPI00313DC5B3
MPSTPAPLPTRRADLLARLAAQPAYDVAVVGGGATGLGVALDAAARGFSVVLVESHDFAKGTSSRSTKLVHGGVRYLAQGNIALVREALHERSTLLHNAPHLAQPLAFVMPSYRWWETPFYGLGLTAYDMLAGRAGLGKTELLNRADTLRHLPTVAPQGLRGGVKYWDGQFNDARLALALARTAAARGALLLNYCEAVELSHHDGQITGLVCADTLSGQRFPIHARCVVNATGVWVDRLREKDDLAKAHRPIVAPSQGVHLVVDREFLGGDTALLVPKTADGRVLFAVPWLGKVILGTTDTARPGLELEPQALKEEVDFILNEAGRCLRKAPTRADVKSIWVGLRPLVKPPEDGEGSASISREHTVLLGRSGLVTVTGGKWTTYRAMAEDVLAKCAERRLIKRRPGGVTTRLPLVGAGNGSQVPLEQAPGEHSYGSEQAALRELPGQDITLCPGLTEAMVRFAARHEYAITVEDVLARRSRLLFLDARLARQLAPRVAAILAEEHGLPVQLPEFQALAQRYTQLP